MGHAPKGAKEDYDEVFLIPVSLSGSLTLPRLKMDLNSQPLHRLPCDTYRRRSQKRACSLVRLFRRLGGASKGGNHSRSPGSHCPKTPFCLIPNAVVRYLDIGGHAFSQVTSRAPEVV